MIGLICRQVQMETLQRIRPYTGNLLIGGQYFLRRRMAENKGTGTAYLFDAETKKLIMQTPAFLAGHPMVVQVAIQQAGNLGRNILSLVKTGAFVSNFRYRDKGSMAIIGKN